MRLPGLHNPLHDHGSDLLPRVFSIFLIFTALGALAPAWGQQPSLSAAIAVPRSPIAVGPAWSELSADQQKILAPLSPSWDTLESARKRKWIALAQTYPQLAPAEQAKLQGRMAEWAALSPRERALARLNYSETKRVPASDRAANWDAYQALPDEDKQKLAAQAASTPKGAALAPKHSTQDKVTPVPVTRRTPAEERASVGATAPTIDRKTLLPQAAKPVKAAASSPAS